MTMTRARFGLVALVLLVLAVPLQAADARSRADAAVADILFDYDGAEEFASYAVRADGFVDITFARNMPDTLYSELLAKLQNHAHIPGVLTGKSGRACRLW